MVLAALPAVMGSGLLAVSASAAGMAKDQTPTPTPVLGSNAASPSSVVPTTSTTTLSMMPNPAVTNQAVILTAVITSSSSLVSPSGTVTFYRGSLALSGCANEPVATDTGTATVTCQQSFAASTSPEPLRAVFAPMGGSGMAGSSYSATFDVNRGPTSIRVSTSKATVNVGDKVTYTAVPDALAGAVSPWGVVKFLDRGKAVRSCTGRPLHAGTAICTVRYRTTGRHTITAVYRGDLNFLASPASTSQSVRVLARARITSTMSWTFAYRPTYTKILALSVNAAPVGTTVVVKCHGIGCPFAKRSTPVTRCGSTRSHACKRAGSATIGLAASFRRRRLDVGTGVSVQILRPGWIGKYYLFTMRAGRGPKIEISCLAPGRTVPGQGC
jgi:hypothetical protein